MSDVEKVVELRNLKVKEVSIVDRGANPGATVALLKRDAPRYIVTQKFNYDATDYSVGQAVVKTEFHEAAFGQLLSRGWVEPAAKENEVEKTVITKAQAEKSLDSIVEKRRRDGESAGQTLSRLIKANDRETAEAYENYSKAPATSLSELTKAHKENKAAVPDDEDDQKDMQDLEECAKSIAKRDGCTIEKAFLKAMTEKPAVYDRMENRAIAKGRREPS